MNVANTEPVESTAWRETALRLVERHRQFAVSLTDASAIHTLDTGLVDRLSSLYRVPLAAEPAELSRVGLGYRVHFERAGVLMTLDRIRENRGELHGELNVSLTADGRIDGGHLYGARYNVHSGSARTSVAKVLTSRVAADWQGMLEQFCLAVLNAERQGHDFEQVGQRPREDAARYLMTPLLPLGTATIVFGAGGTGKSTFAAAVAVATATGRPVLKGWDPTPGQVLVLDWEDRAATWNDRIAAIAGGIGAPAPLIHYRGMAQPLADDLETVAAYVADQCIMLLIVDSLGLATGATKDGEAMSDSVFRLFAALRALGITTLLIDHVAGADLEAVRPTAKPFGSIYKLNLARSAFELRRERDGDADRTELALVHTKANASARLPVTGLAIVRDGDVIRFERNDVEAPELVAALSAPERMRRLLRDGAQPTSLIGKELGIPESHVRTILARDKGRHFTRLADARVGLVSHAG